MCLNPVCVLTFIEMKKMKENKKKKTKRMEVEDDRTYPIQILDGVCNLHVLVTLKYHPINNIKLFQAF